MTIIYLEYTRPRGQARVYKFDIHMQEVTQTRRIRVISAARFENMWLAHLANFENGMGTGLNILFSQIGNIIMSFQ